MRLQARAGEKETDKAVGGEQRAGMGQVPAAPHWFPGPDLGHPCHFSEPLRQRTHHPEVSCQYGYSPNKLGPTTARMKGKPPLKQLAL